MTFGSQPGERKTQGMTCFGRTQTPTGQMLLPQQEPMALTGQEAPGEIDSESLW